MARRPLVYCVGEALWDLHSPRGTPLASARTLRLEPGGAAVLVAMHLAGAGIAVGLAASVGDDAIGRALRDRVGARGVDVRAVKFVKARTPILFIGHPADGDRELVGYRRLEDELIVAPPAVARPSLLHVASISPLPTHARALAAIGKRARQQGAILTVDVNARPRVWRAAAARARLPPIADAHLVKASADDLEVIGMGKGIRAIASMRVRMRPEATLVVTRGKGPITAHGPFGAIESSVRSLGDVDPTGAGDAFMAGVIASLLDSQSANKAEKAWIEAAIARGAAFARAHLRKRRA